MLDPAFVRRVAAIGRPSCLGDQYLFYINSVGTSGYKQDPRARALTFQPAFPFANCVLRNPGRFPCTERVLYRRRGFPRRGRWLEVFNSDVYDNWVNPLVAGNCGGVDANGPPMHGLPNSATLTIPANGLLIFAKAHV